MLNPVNIDEYKQQVATFFNHRTNYDGEGNFHPRLANRLLELAQLHKGQKILDVATGTGLVAISAAQVVGTEGKVVEVDISTGMLNQARQKIAAASLQNLELIEADAEYLNFSNDSFDAILCSSAFVYLSDIPAALYNWHRWLRKDGLVAFSCFSETSFMTPIIIKVCAKVCGVSLPNINEPLGTPENCHKLLEKAGFQDVEVRTEQFGSYLSLNDAKGSWNRRWFHPKGNPLLRLSPEQLERLKAEYIAKLEALATDKGIWNDITTFFVLARKKADIQ